MATAYYAPGVYIEEPDRGTKPIEGVSTSVTAFVGFTQKAEDLDRENDPNGFLTKSILGRPKTITNWNQYKQHFGDFIEDAYLPHAVRGFFENGGVRCYVISVQARQAHRAQVIVSGVKKEKDKEFPRLLVRVKEHLAGDAGNDVKVSFRIRNSSTSTTSGTTSGSSTTSSTATSTTGGSSTAGTADSTTTGASGATGSATATAANSAATNGSTNGAKSEILEMIVRLPTKNQDEPPVEIKLNELPPWQARDQEAAVKAASLPSQEVEVWSLVGRNDVLAPEKPKQNFAFILNGGSNAIDNSLLPSGATLAPAPDGSLLLPTAPRHFEGDSRRGITALEALDDVNLVCVPELWLLKERKIFTDKQVVEVQNMIIGHCMRMLYRFAVLDSPPNIDVDGVKDWRMNAGLVDPPHGHAALYYPWIKMDDPLNPGRMIRVPPCGHMAGIYARSDTQRGVHKAPANEPVLGVIDLDYHVNRAEQEMLNPIGINCIRKFSGRGLRVWGARTLALTDPSWRYVNVRRIFNYVEDSIERATQWVVFEPNDPILWGKVRRDVSAFLRTVWLSGALFGNTPDEAYYVKCDAELNPPETRDLGYLFIEIGMAPVKPAEFVVFRISQWAGPNAEG